MNPLDADRQPRQELVVGFALRPFDTLRVVPSNVEGRQAHGRQPACGELVEPRVLRLTFS